MALRALNSWGGVTTNLHGGLRVADVGGSGSRFHEMVSFLGHEVKVIDPGVNCLLHEFVDSPQSEIFPAVFCISVIEHVKDLTEFIEDISRIVAPGGLLFFTTDIWDQPTGVPDTAHFHWMRERIFNKESWMKLSQELYERGFGLTGWADWNYHGGQVYGGHYSFASLAMERNPVNSNNPWQVKK